MLFGIFFANCAPQAESSARENEKARLAAQGPSDYGLALNRESSLTVGAVALLGFGRRREAGSFPFWWQPRQCPTSACRRERSVPRTNGSRWRSVLEGEGDLAAWAHGVRCTWALLAGLRQARMAHEFAAIARNASNIDGPPAVADAARKGRAIERESKDSRKNWRNAACGLFRSRLGMGFTR